MLGPSLDVLSSSRKINFVRSNGGSLKKALAEFEPSLLLASSDFDYSRIIRLKNGKIGDLQMPPVIMCVTHDVLENEELYEGIDDFVVIPCSVAELDKRVKRLTTNGVSETPLSSIKVGEITIDMVNYRVSVSHQTVRLAWMEFQLLKFLMQNPGRIFTREELLANVWDTEHFGQTRTVDVHVRRLRFKLGQSASGYLRTVTNVGYGLVSPAN